MAIRLNRWVAPALVAVGLVGAVLPGTGPALAAHPGGNGKIAFVSSRDGNNEIYIVDDDGTNEKRLTTNQANDLEPEFSPDGKKIAFSSNRGGNFDLYTMDPQGGSVTKITNSGDIDVDGTWSPDGTKFAFMRNVGQQFDIFVINSDGSGTGGTNITNNPAFDGVAKWSPDGSTIAFTSSRGDPNPDTCGGRCNFDIYLMNPDGTNVRRMTNEPGVEDLADFSPDGTKLVFESDRTGNSDIFVMELVAGRRAARSLHGDPGGAVTNVTKTPQEEHGPTFSPNGDFLAFAQEQNDTSQLVLLPFGGGVFINITNTQGDNAHNFEPTWQTTFTCPTELVNGYFEPTQGSWQDDPFFIDHGDKTPHLVELTTTSYEAPLPMVRGRKSLLFGIYQAKEKPKVDDRFNIVIQGLATGTTNVPVRMKFTLSGTGELYTSGVLGQIPLDPPCNEEQPFRIVLPVPLGAPPTQPAFTFPTTGGYKITNELIRPDGGTTGLEVSVSGTTVATGGPKLLYVPLVVSDSFDSAFLTDATIDMKNAFASRGPDYIPIAQGSNAIPSATRGVLDISGHLAAGSKAWKNWVKQLDLRVHDENDAIKQALVDQFFRFAAMQGGYDRVVAMVTPVDLTSLLGHRGANGATMSGKVILIAAGQANQFTLGHELAHSQPYLWSSDQMPVECGYNYHNMPGDKITHGVQITLNGVENRVLKENFNHLMAANDERWTDQCTYWHFVKILQNLKDPPVLLVQARVAQVKGKEAGQLLPTYSIENGTVDLNKRKAKKGEWSIVLKNKSGKSLGTFPFTPEFELDIEPEHLVRQLLALSFQLPQAKGVAQIQLRGPDGKLDSLRFSAREPRVSITDPVDLTQVSPDAEGNVTVSWKGTDADRNKLLYSVLYSPDGGESWMPQAFEQAGTSAAVLLDPASQSHMVKVIVTDRSRSAEDVVTFSTP